jgi:lipid II:glycine glycyltransferase (peptidoglycan interpeptide bridge formation enzyme)
VKNWLMGSRMVSLPFSDHCQPLVRDSEDLQILLSSFRKHLDREKWKYIELRPMLASGECQVAGGKRWPYAKAEEYYFHKLNLQPSLDGLFRSFHKSCVQRKILRAEREHLAYEAGRSESILARFYRLFLLTRRRHQLPPQPIAWFRNLVGCLGDRLTIRLLSKDDQPIASILTLSYKTTLVYKYGCSDARFHNLGGMPLLFWRAIQEGKQWGAHEFDLGRSDVDNPGLSAFKEHLGATRSALSYFRLTRHRAHRHSRAREIRAIRCVFGAMPDAVAQLAGRVLYRHMG